MIIHSIKICSSCILLFQEPQKFSISTGSNFFNCRIFVSTRPSWFLLLRSPSFIFRSRYKSKMLIPSDDDSQSTHRIQYTLQNQYLSRLFFYFSVWHDLKTAVLKRYEYPNYLGITLLNCYIIISAFHKHHTHETWLSGYLRLLPELYFRLMPEITLKYVTLKKNSLWVAGVNMVFNPSFILDPNQQESFKT